MATAQKDLRRRRSLGTPRGHPLVPEKAETRLPRSRGGFGKEQNGPRGRCLLRLSREVQSRWHTPRLSPSQAETQNETSSSSERDVRTSPCDPQRLDAPRGNASRGSASSSGKRGPAHSTLGSPRFFFLLLLVLIRTSVRAK